MNVFPPILRSLAAALLLVATSTATRGQAVEPAPAAPSFEIEVRAPEAQRELLLRHLDLRRYREVPDLDDNELARLLTLAERDARQLLATQGYFTPGLAMRVDRSSTPPRVLIEVQPGPATQVRDVAIAYEGHIAQPDDAQSREQRNAIAEGWRLRAGEPFTQAGWDDAKSDALRTLTARRYLRGRIAQSTADVDARAGEARLSLRFDSGPRFRLGPMVVTGVERYDPRLAPRLARLPEGSEYDRDRLVQAQLRLAGSGYFDSAFIYIDPDSDPDAAPVQVNLREAKMQRLTAGLGLTTDRGPRLSLEHRHNSVPGIGWRADSRLQLDRVSPMVETELTSIPDADLWRWGVSGRLEYQRDNGQDIRVIQTRVGRLYTGERIDRHYYLQYDAADVRNPGTLPPQDTGDGTAVSANYVWTGRYFNDTLSPTRGWGFGFELGGGLTLTGSRSPFQRTVGRALYYWPLATGRIQLRGEAGAVLARQEARVPATQQFRTGGDTTVRGYGFRDIGVRQADGSIRPGRYLASGSVEWQRPVRQFGDAGVLEHTVFIDAGAVADVPGDLSPWTGIGTGVRFLSPIGPLQADIAYGLETRRLRIHLNVGVSF